MPSLNAALEADNLWQHQASQISTDLVADPTGKDFYWLKKQFKIWFYKAMQGGNPFSKQESHVPLKELFPLLSGAELKERGDAIVQSCKPITDLTILQEEVKQLSQIYFPGSSTPFRYSWKDPSKDALKNPPYSIWSWQKLERHEIPSLLDKATVPQKVSRVLCGIEVVLLLKAIESLNKGNLGVPLQLEHDGATILTRKGEGKQMVSRLDEEVGSFAKEFTGRFIGIEGRLISSSSKSQFS